MDFGLGWYDFSVGYTRCVSDIRFFGGGIHCFCCCVLLGRGSPFATVFCNG